MCILPTVWYARGVSSGRANIHCSSQISDNLPRYSKRLKFAHHNEPIVATLTWPYCDVRGQALNHQTLSDLTTCRPMSPSSPSRACTSSPMLAPAMFPPLSMTFPSHTPATALPTRKIPAARPSSGHFLHSHHLLHPHHLHFLLNPNSNPSPVP